MKAKSLGSMYSLLAASSRFVPKGSLQRVCLVPYWKQGDLEDLAEKLEYPTECDAGSRYFVSGETFETSCVSTLLWISIGV
jgi:hypothetical protein